MDEKILQIILDKQDKISDDIVVVKVILAKQEENLEYHVKRTDIAEENIELLRRQLEADLKPIKSHVAFINSVLKIVGGLSVALSIVASIVKILGFFS